MSPPTLVATREKMHAGRFAPRRWAAMQAPPGTWQTRTRTGSARVGHAVGREVMESAAWGTDELDFVIEERASLAISSFETATLVRGATLDRSVDEDDELDLDVELVHVGVPRNVIASIHVTFSLDSLPHMAASPGLDLAWDLDDNEEEEKDEDEDEVAGRDG